MISPEGNIPPHTIDYFTTLLPIFTLILGIFLTSAFEYFREGRTSKREQKVRKVKREESIVSNRIEFQRETLLKLQEAINEMGRQTSKLHIFDLDHLRKGGKWQDPILPPDVDEAQRAAVSLVSLLYVRLHDKNIKMLVDEFRTDANNTLKSVDKLNAEQAFQKMHKTFVLLNEKIGEQLLDLDSTLIGLIRD